MLNCYVSNGVDVKFYLVAVLALLSGIQGCSSNNSHASKHMCLSAVESLYELENSDIRAASISVTMAGDKGSVYFKMNGNQIKIICSKNNFGISNNGISTSILDQKIYYFQNSKNELVEAQKSNDRFWYSTLTPKNTKQWFAVFVSTET